MSVQKLIENKLLRSRDSCEFKKAWIPKGWACVFARKFAEELKEDMEKAGYLRISESAPDEE